MANTRIQIPAVLQRGEVFEVRLLIRHSMETGGRHDDTGRPIPRNVVNQLLCRYNGVEIFRADLFPGIAANPYLTFFTTAEASGDLEVSWRDDAGTEESERVPVVVKE